MPHEGKFVELPAEELSNARIWETVRLGTKEGLSLVNGTTLTTAMAVKAWYEGDHLLQVANCAAAMSIEALGGSRTPSATRSSSTRTSERWPPAVRSRLAGEQWLGAQRSARRPPLGPDPYSLRCAPQVHGAIWEEFRASESCSSAK